MRQTLSRIEPSAPHPKQVTSPIGYQGLADQDLLAAMLARAVGDPDTLAGALLDRFGSLGGVAAADAGELCRVAGVCPLVLGDLRLLRELAVRLAREEACLRPVITSWTSLLAYARAALAHQPREQFRVLYLDRRNILIQDEFIADGTVDHAPVYPREVVRRALELSACAMILLHNHPSGDPAPSRADIEMTRQIVEAARLFSLQVHDHLVIGREGTASFKQLGLI